MSKKINGVSASFTYSYPNWDKMKDYDYENFKEFMRHFNAIDEYENLDITAQIIGDLEEIDKSVNNITGCNQAINMLESIGVKTC